MNLPAFAPIFNDSDKTEMNHLHLYLKELTNFKNRLQAKTDFLTLARATYPAKDEKSFINNFEKKYNEYKRKDILHWYSKECFLYKLTNNCLRIATSDSILYCRLLLKDLEQAIKEQYQAKSKNFNGLLYRAAYMSDEQWKSLQANIGQEIEMHGFLSTSKKEKTALRFMQSDPKKKVFITIVVPKGPNEEEQGFADIAELAEFPEQEVLFNIRSRFTILETESKYKPMLPYRHLVLLYGAQGFRKHMIEKEEPAKEISIPSAENISCKVCRKGATAEEMFFLSLEDRQNRTYICQNCCPNFLKENNIPLLCISTSTEEAKYSVNGFTLAYPERKQLQIPLYGYSCHKCQAKKQAIYFKCIECNQGKEKFCEKCHLQECINKKHPIILESNPFSFWCEKMSDTELYHFNYQNGVITKDKLFSQAEVYSQSHQHQKVIEFYKTYIQRNEKTGDYLELATAYNNLGRGYENKADYKEALINYFKCLELSKSALQKDHPDLTTSYNNIGNVFKRQGEFSKAQEYYSKALNLSKTVDYENQSDLATSYNNLGNVHYSKGEYKEALENYFEALKIFELLKGESHPLVATIYNNIASAYQNQGEDQKALEYQKKALENGRVVHGEKHPDVAASYNNMGRVYEKQGKLKEALENYSKSLGIYKAICGENHPDLTTILNNIGNIHYLQGDNDKALENYSNALKVSKSDSDRAKSYHNLANASYSKEEYNTALECSSKALKIFQKIHEPDHLHVASASLTLANIYKNTGEYQKALDYYAEALRIFEKIFTESHAYVADCLNNIGVVYYSQEKYTETLEFLFKSLKIKRIVYEENHPSVAASYWGIGDTYNCMEKYSEALEFQVKSLNVRKAIYGDNHYEVANSLSGIGKVYFYQGEHLKALESYSEALNIRKSVLGDGHPDTKAIFDQIQLISQIEKDSQHQSHMSKS